MTSSDRIRRCQRLAVAAALLAGLATANGKGNAPPPPLADPPGRQIQVFGVWHCGNHYCDWSQVMSDAEFDAVNHWLIDRGDGNPAVNVVVLSFVHPLKLLQRTDSGVLNMIPPGMTPDVVNYFTSRNIRVMLSIGGITYTDAWDAALAINPSQLGLNAAELAKELGVGIEIDYENSSSPNIAGLQSFIDAYRSKHPYDATGTNHAARLTIDVAAGDRWLIALNRHATQYWLDPRNPVLDYANAMVSGTASGTPTDWQEHVDGKPQYVPKVPPLAPARFTGGLYLKGNSANCLNFASSEQKADADYVRRVKPNAGFADIQATPGMLGYMFWAAGIPSARKGYVPTTNCDGGMGIAAATFNIPLPLPALPEQ